MTIAPTPGASQTASNSPSSGATLMLGIVAVAVGVLILLTVVFLGGGGKACGASKPAANASTVKATPTAVDVESSAANAVEMTKAGDKI